MKQLSKKAIVVSSILALVIVPSITIAALNSTKPEPIAKPVPAVVTQPEETPVVEPVVNTEPAVEVVAPVEAPVVVEVPAARVVLSVQEYAEKYLNLSTPRSQACFDRIVQVWPDRFVPEVREQNIKALTIWAGICATGVDSRIVDQLFERGTPSLQSSLIAAYGENGEFFDSEVAKRASAN